MEEYDDEPSYRIKVIVVGDSTVGKTSLISQYNSFQDGEIPRTSSTIACESINKKFSKNDELVSVDVWDTIGQEKHQSMSQSYYRNASGALIVYSITAKESFKKLPEWIKRVKEGWLPDWQIMLLGNKWELKQERAIEYEDGYELSLAEGTGFNEIGAKTGENLGDSFNKLIEDILDKSKATILVRESDNLKISNQSKSKYNNSTIIHQKPKDKWKW